MMFHIGICFEEEIFKVAILKKEKKKVSIESLHTFSYGPDHVKLFYNLPPFHTGKEVSIVSGIASKETFIRKMHIPLRERRKLLAALPFQLESLLPFSEENPLICPLFTPLGKKMTAVTVIATTQSALTSHLSSLSAIKITSDIVSCIPMALMRFGRWKLGEEHRILHFDAADQTISCVVYEAKEMILSQTIFSGKNVELGSELEKLSLFLKQKGAINEKTTLLLTGQPAPHEHIQRVFSELKIEKERDAYAAATGLALDAAQKDALSIQFCEAKFTPVPTLQKRKKKALAYLSFTLGAALLMTIGGSVILNEKQKNLTQKLEDYLPSSISKESLSTKQEIEDILLEWEKSLRGKKNNFALLPNIPKVSDILAWLSAHPSFTKEDGMPKEGVEIKSLHYSLTKYPTLSEPSSNYTAELAVEFFSQTPREARDFHEALLKEDPMVGGKKEVKWHSQNQTHSASFELSHREP